jgi:hypothetical protein
MQESSMKQAGSLLLLPVGYSVSETSVYIELTDSSEKYILWKRLLSCKQRILIVRFEIFTAVTMKNGVLRDVTPCGSCKNRRFGGT